MVIRNFCFNGNAFFELNMFEILPRLFPLQNSSSWTVNGMGTSHIIQQDRPVHYQFFTQGVDDLLIGWPSQEVLQVMCYVFSFNLCTGKLLHVCIHSRQERIIGVAPLSRQCDDLQIIDIDIIQALSTFLKMVSLIFAVVNSRCVVLFGVNGNSERIFHFLERKDVCHGVIIYTYFHRQDVQDAPHGVVHVTSITVNVEVLFQWVHSDF